MNLQHNIITRCHCTYRFSAAMHIHKMPYHDVRKSSFKMYYSFCTITIKYTHVITITTVTVKTTHSACTHRYLSSVKYICIILSNFAANSTLLFLVPRLLTPWVHCVITITAIIITTHSSCTHQHLS